MSEAHEFLTSQFLREVDFFVSQGLLTPGTAAQIRSELNSTHGYNSGYPPTTSSAAVAPYPPPAAAAASVTKSAPMPSKKQGSFKQPSPSPPPYSGPPKKRARALYDNQQIEPDDLPFHVGDVIDNVEDVDADWCRGSCNGAVGIFPRSLVEILDGRHPGPPPSGPAPAPTVVVVHQQQPQTVVVQNNSNRNRYKDIAAGSAASGFGFGIGTGIARKLI